MRVMKSPGIISFWEANVAARYAYRHIIMEDPSENKAYMVYMANLPGLGLSSEAELLQ